MAPSSMWGRFEESMLFTGTTVCGQHTHQKPDLFVYTSDRKTKNNTNLPVFKLKESSVRRRYSDFEWLRYELERDSKSENGVGLVASRTTADGDAHSNTSR
ncbi:hypothetical protein LAZ67_2005765 [Cordylochernes scorpioides]|uniref:Sorting nexin-3 n=1 Tax=Cordylochernes scorpioides TaxID=51811 RepID=A0ABY6K4U9_9ARAC|nr:hypothetical protein LAZ67_2005765 [Cordylochernes scorpioides]